MKKIGRIILAWWYWITNRNDVISRERLQICAQCELRVWFVCGECSCPLQAKSRIIEEQCPKYKWPGDHRHIPTENAHSNLGNYPYTKQNPRQLPTTGGLRVFA